MAQRFGSPLVFALSLMACSPGARPGNAADAYSEDASVRAHDATLFFEEIDARRDTLELFDAFDANAHDLSSEQSSRDAIEPLDVPLPNEAGAGIQLCRGSDINVQGTTGDSRFVSAVWTGTEYALAWQDESAGTWNIRFARIRADGSVLDHHDVTAESGPGAAANEYPSLAWDGTRYWVAWARTPLLSARATIRVASIALNAEGTPVVGEARDVPSTSAEGDTLPSLVALPESVGGGLALAWEDGRHGADNHEIYFARLDATGARIGAEVRVTNAPRFSGRPVLVWNARDSELGLFWQDDRDEIAADPNEDIYFTRLLVSGARAADASDARITRDTVRSLWHSAAFDGAGYGVAWVNEDLGGDTPLVYFLRVDARGTPAPGAAPVRLSSAPKSNREYSTAVAWNGAEFLVAWQDNRPPHLNGDLVVRRVSPAGVPLGSEYLLGEDRNTSDHAALIWGRGEWFIAWEDDRDGHRDVWFRRMPRDFCVGM